MANEFQENLDAVVRGQSLNSDDSFNKEISEQRQAGEQNSDMTSVWKDKYIHLLADLDNTKKCLVRNSARGELFDPNLHDAIGMVQHPAAAPNTVVRVERKGYLYHGRLLRPAQVLVAAG